MRSTLCEKMILINLFVEMFVKSSGFSYFFCFSTTNYRLCFKSYFNSLINIEWKPLLQYWLPVAKSADVLLVAHIFPSSTSYWASFLLSLQNEKLMANWIEMPKKRYVLLVLHKHKAASSCILWKRREILSLIICLNNSINKWINPTLGF